MVVGHDSLVGTATRRELHGSEIESRWGLNFPHQSRPTQGPTQRPIQWLLFYFRS